MSLRLYLKLHYVEKYPKIGLKLCQILYGALIFSLFGAPFRKQRLYREVAEWSKAHAWKVCIRQKRIEGSNPFLSAKTVILTPINGK
jgi:hypothetical protein